MDYKYFGLLSFAILACGLTFIVWRWPQGKHKTFSQHVAVAPHKIFYYAALFAITLPLLVSFFLEWFAPAFALPSLFNVSIILAAITQQACTLIPETGGWKTSWHNILAGISAFSLMPPLVLILTSDRIPVAGRAITLAGLMCMASIITVLAMQRGKYHHLILQTAYYAAFFAPVLAISYIL